MGLGGAKLLVAVEETFAVAILDGDAARLSTVGELHTLVLSKLPGAPSSTGLVVAAFCQLRQALMQDFRLQRSQIRPSTSLGPHMPLWRRRGRWRRLEHSAQLTLPALESPWWVHIVLIVAAISVAIAPIYFGVMPANPLMLGIFLLVVALTVYRVLLRMTPMLRVGFPVRPATLGALAREVLSLNYSALALKKDARHAEQVWSRLCEVIAARTQTDPGNIHPNDRLVADLGID